MKRQAGIRGPFRKPQGSIPIPWLLFPTQQNVSKELRRRSGHRGHLEAQDSFIRIISKGSWAAAGPPSLFFLLLSNTNTPRCHPDVPTKYGADAPHSQGWNRKLGQILEEASLQPRKGSATSYTSRESSLKDPDGIVVTDCGLSFPPFPFPFGVRGQVGWPGLQSSCKERTSRGPVKRRRRGWRMSEIVEGSVAHQS